MFSCLAWAEYCKVQETSAGLWRWRHSCDDVIAGVGRRQLHEVCHTRGVRFFNHLLAFSDDFAGYFMSILWVSALPVFPRPRHVIAGADYSNHWRLQIYERGLKAIPLSVDLWTHYLNFATIHLTGDDYEKTIRTWVLKKCPVLKYAFTQFRRPSSIVLQYAFPNFIRHLSSSFNT